MRSSGKKIVGVVALALALGTVAAARAYVDKDPPIPKDQGEIHIETKPAGFSVVVDGQPSGVTYLPGKAIRVRPGTHHVEILFPDKPWSQDLVVEPGKRSFIRLSYARKPLFSPCPYHPDLAVEHARYGEGEVMKFTSDVSYTGTLPLNYTWTITPSSARVIGPNNGPELRIDTKGLGGQTVRAALTMTPGYGGEKCIVKAEASAEVVTSGPINAPDSPEAEAPAFDINAEKDRLDRFAEQMGNHPDATGYLIYYGGQTGKPEDFERYTAASINYLVETRGVDRARVKVLQGPTMASTFIEMWLVPKGGTPPVPKGATLPTAPKTDTPSPVRSRTVPKQG
jgi:hypothetical protein